MDKYNNKYTRIHVYLAGDERTPGSPVARIVNYAASGFTSSRRIWATPSDQV